MPDKPPLRERVADAIDYAFGQPVNGRSDREVDLDAADALLVVVRDEIETLRVADAVHQFDVCRNGTLDNVQGLFDAR